MARTTFYAQVKPTFWNSWGDQRPRVQAINVVKTTQKKPKAQLGGTVMVKLTLDIPDEAFLPLEPEAVIVVPASLVTAKPIEVEATKPEDDSA